MYNSFVIFSIVIHCIFPERKTIMVEKQFQQNDIIIREGESGESFFQLVNGSAAVLAGADTADEKKLTELRPGDYFGELAILSNYQRSATVKALEDNTAVLEIPGSKVTDYFSDQPDKILALMKHLSSRIRQLTLDYKEAASLLDEMASGKKWEQNDGFFARIRRFIADAGRGTEKNAEETLRQIQTGPDSGYAKHVNSFPKGTVIFREGDEANCMFDIHHGIIGIYTGYGTSGQKLIAELPVNRFFGEMGMIDQEPRSATAVVLSDEAALETIYPEDLEDLFRQNPPKVSMILQHLSLRLKRLTNDYLDICRKLSELSAM